MKAPLPSNEEERLKALHRYEILDTDPEQEFDDITLLASQVCGTPIAMISLVDQNRQWFKSKIGMTESETSRDIAFCAHGILQTDAFIVRDAQVDERFASNPLVTGNPKIRFYAGSPLITSDGYALGMLCVHDQVPRELNAEQKTALQALSRQVVAQLELRLALTEVRRTVAQLKRAEEALKEKTAFLEAQINSSFAGILVVDEHSKKILQNQKLTDLLKIPQDIADDQDDEKQLRWVTGTTKHPEQFLEKVTYLYSHPNEISHDEIEFQDGRILDRYSSPVIGKDGKLYGRIWAFRDITERKRAESLVRQSEERYRNLFDNARDAIFTIAPDGTFTSLNAAVEPLGGISRADWIGKSFAPMVHPDDLSLARDMFTHTMQGEQVPVHELRGNPSLKRPALMEMTLVAQKDESGKIIGVLGIGRDITERKRFEAQMIQSQRLETVGKLAGGVAHEFNSILTAIIGQSELILSDLPPQSPLGKSVVEIHRAADRAATLTRQLLAYGRKQILQPETVDLNLVLADMESTLHHLVGRDVDVRLVPAAGLKSVKIDPGQIEQVIMNIVMNATAVMPNGGKLTLETANVTLGQEYAGHFPDLKAGEYVMLAISDTGPGISPEVKKHLFEPFFSTKGVGEGTGLGLATCYGILKQSGGHINVYSELSRGATFKVYLPPVEAPAQIPIPRTETPDLPRGSETILLVEDDPALREMASALLQRLGYTVWTAADGVEALSLKHQRGVGHVDLVFTDVIMPNMSGKELSDRFKVLYPQTKILFTSAYTENAIVHQGVLNPGVTLLQKPFTPSALARKVREVLDRDRGNANG